MSLCLCAMAVAAMLLHGSAAVESRVVAAPKCPAGGCTNSTVAVPEGFLPICDMCYVFFECCLDDIVNIILNGGGSTCAAICSAIPNTLYAQVCQVLCDGVGVSIFTGFLLQTDTFPIALCVDMKACTANTCKGSCGKIDSFGFAPSVASSGQPISITFDFAAVQAIGTGEVFVQITGPDVLGRPRVIEQHKLIESGMNATTHYPYTLSVPTNGYVIPCPSGLYKGNVSICAGDCLDTKNGVVLDSVPFSFTLS